MRHCRSSAMVFTHYGGVQMGLLSADIQANILVLCYSEKRSLRSIARQFGIDPKTVRRFVLRRTVCLNVKSSARQSILDPYKSDLLEFLRKDPKVTNTSLLTESTPCWHILQVGFNVPSLWRTPLSRQSMKITLIIFSTHQANY